MRKAISCLILIGILLSNSLLVYAIDEKTEKDEIVSENTDSQDAIEETGSGEENNLEDTQIKTDNRLEDPKSSDSLNTGMSENDENNPYIYFAEEQFNNGQQIHQLKDPGAGSVNQFTGEAGYRYSITLPRARGLIDPVLNLIYSSHQTGEETILGYGWGITENKITRNTKRGTDLQYSDDSTIFLELMDQKTELTKISDDGAKKIYHPRYGGDELRAVYMDENYVVHDSRGNKYIFNNKQGGFAWYLTEIEDLNGNKIIYRYITAGGQIYPGSIEYNEVTGSAKTAAHFYLRSKPTSILDGRRGFLVTTTKEIEKIEIQVDGKKRREIKLDYIKGANGERDLLSGIEEIGYDEAGNSHGLPKTEFGYQEIGESGWAEADTLNYSTANVHLCKYQHRGTGEYDRFTSVDLGVVNTYWDANGVIDAVTMGLLWTNGESAERCPFKIRENGIRLGDINGDQQIDKIQGKVFWNWDKWQCDIKTYLNQGGKWEENETLKSPVCPIKEVGNNEPILDRGTQLIDINGDGLADIVQAFDGDHYYQGDCDWAECNGRTLKIYINNGNTWERSNVWESGFPDNIQFAKYNISGGRQIVKSGLMRFADFNNDGLSDIVTFYGVV